MLQVTHYNPDQTKKEEVVRINSVVPGTSEWERRKKVAKRCRKQTKMYQKRAEQKQFGFDANSIVDLFRQPCFYCGDATRYENGEPVCGVDRVDNSRGYVAENMVPCCTICNFMKGSFSLEEFLDHCVKISRRELLIREALNKEEIE